MASEAEFDSARHRRLLERVTRAKAGTARSDRSGSRPSFPRWALSAETEGSRRKQRVLGPPPVCLLERAAGGDKPCAQADCVFFRVPGTRMDCAVEQWAPSAERDPEIAAWFNGMRACADRARTEA